MINPMAADHVSRWSKEMAPAMVVLVVNIVFSLFVDNPALHRGSEVFYRVFFRFFRFTLLLCLPLYILLPVFSFVVDKIRRTLVQTWEKQELLIHPTKHWIFRPFQGIGIGLLFETKLLVALQVIAGVTARPFLSFSGGQLQAGRLLVISGITVIVSLLLSTLWTLDDIGIRYVNRKDKELKMIGKYVGTLMPVIFGFYGILSIVADFPKVQALTYLFKTIIILYPPFLVFSVFHTHFIRSKGEHFSQKALLENGGIWWDEESRRAGNGR